MSYTDPVHSFIISYRAVEPTGSSLQLLLGIVIGNYHLQLAIVLTNKTILITGWNWSCLETFLLFTTMATAGNWLIRHFIESQIWSDVAIWHSREFHIKFDQILFFLAKIQICSDTAWWHHLPPLRMLSTLSTTGSEPLEGAFRIKKVLRHRSLALKPSSKIAIIHCWGEGWFEKYAPCGNIEGRDLLTIYNFNTLHRKLYWQYAMLMRFIKNY